MCEIVYNILITNFTVHRCIIRSNAPSNLQMQPLGCIFVYALNCITFGTAIEAAAGGDVEAINTVLKHYAGYIARLSMRELYDEYGNPHLCVDEELRRRLETKLITKLLTFRVR